MTNCPQPVSTLSVEPPGGWPDGFWAVPYVGTAVPGSDTPPSGLWADTVATAAVGNPRPLDLGLVNARPRYATLIGWKRCR